MEALNALKDKKMWQGITLANTPSKDDHDIWYSIYKNKVCHNFYTSHYMLNPSFSETSFLIIIFESHLPQKSYIILAW